MTILFTHQAFRINGLLSKCKTTSLSLISQEKIRDTLLLQLTSRSVLLSWIRSGSSLRIFKSPQSSLLGLAINKQSCKDAVTMCFNCRTITPPVYDLGVLHMLIARIYHRHDAIITVTLPLSLHTAVPIMPEECFSRKRIHTRQGPPNASIMH